MGSDDTGAWFERRLAEPSFVIPEIADFRRQRVAAAESPGAIETLPAATLTLRLFSERYRFTAPRFPDSYSRQYEQFEDRKRARRTTRTRSSSGTFAERPRGGSRRRMSEASESP